MTPAKLLKSSLYSSEQHDPADIGPRLQGGRCRCGYVFFPMQTYGCERCGSHGDALTPCELSTHGTLLAEATVHLHADKTRPAPFTIVKIALDDGPVVRTLLAEDSAAVAPGQRMVGKLVPLQQGESSEIVLDIRFCAAS
ncbi:Zn-ribbon domain-containing OB-fold protein [Bradyrhizobium erythrophlei]|uniref:Zn-ribbon domain-containing OB-fold protein n=1 Tax=Bradyrhizobium erythrophlei TaxID=1437360 RepID=UPI0035E78634